MSNLDTTIPKGYKQTPVGVIPEEWEVKKFKDCFTHLRTYTLSRNDLTYDECDVCLYNIHYGDIHSTFDKYKLDTEKSIKLLPKVKNANIEEPEYLKNGDIVMADASEDYDGVGSSIELVNVKDKKIISGTHTFALRPKTKFALNYGGYIFANYNVHKSLKRIATGISVFGLSKSNISKIKLPIPPLSEQEKIADCLSSRDKAITDIKKLIEAKQQVKKGLMQQLLTGKKRLAGFTEDWKEVKLGEIFKESKILSTENNKHKRISVRLHLEGIELREVRGTEADSTTFYKRRAGQFIYGKQNFHNGAMGIIPLKFDGYETTSDIPSFDISENVNHNWLFYFISRTDFYKKMENKTTGTGSKRLHPNELFSTIIPFPSIQEQNAIAEILQTADKEIELLEDKLKALETQKKGLMQVLLTGKKRLV